MSIAGYVKNKKLTIKGPMTSDELAELSGLIDLRHLCLNGRWLTSDVLAEHIINLVALETLDLKETYITDNALNMVAKLTLLERLNLRGTKITDIGIRKIAGLKNLQYLDLSYLKITDAIVPVIIAWRSLQRIILVNTDMTETGIQQLQEGCPDLIMDVQKSLQRFLLPKPPKAPTHKTKKISKTEPSVKEEVPTIAAAMEVPIMASADQPTELETKVAEPDALPGDSTELETVSIEPVLETSSTDEPGDLELVSFASDEAVGTINSSDENEILQTESDGTVALVRGLTQDDFADTQLQDALTLDELRSRQQQALAGRTFVKQRQSGQNDKALQEKLEILQAEAVQIAQSHIDDIANLCRIAADAGKSGTFVMDLETESKDKSEWQVMPDLLYRESEYTSKAHSNCLILSLPLPEELIGAGLIVYQYCVAQKLNPQIALSPNGDSEAWQYAIYICWGKESNK